MSKQRIRRAAQVTSDSVTNNPVTTTATLGSLLYAFGASQGWSPETLQLIAEAVGAVAIIVNLIKTRVLPWWRARSSSE